MVSVNVLLHLLDCTSSWRSEVTGSEILNILGIPRDPPGMQWMGPGHPSQGVAGAANTGLQGWLQPELLPALRSPSLQGSGCCSSRGKF